MYVGLGAELFMKQFSYSGDILPIRKLLAALSRFF